MLSTDCLYTTVRNISGVSRVFGYLGPRGRRLAANETFTVPGNLADTLGGKTAQRKFKALCRSLTGDSGARDPSLEIISTPAVIVSDGDVSKQVTLVSGALAVVDPCWALSSSSVAA